MCYSPDGGDIKRRLAVLDWSAPKDSPDSLNPVSPLEHINCFSGHSLMALAEACGLRRRELPLGALSISVRLSLPARTAKDLLRPLYRRIAPLHNAAYFAAKA